MKNGNGTTSPGEMSGFDLKDFAVPVDYLDGAGVPELTVMRVGAPPKNEAIRVYARVQATAWTLDADRERGISAHLVATSLANSNPGIKTALRLRTYHLAVTASGVLFLWSVAPRNPLAASTWTDSAHRALQRASRQWVRVAPERARQSYVLYAPPEALPDPDPSPLTIEQAIEIAFHDRIISSPDHPLIAPLLGREISHDGNDA